ncbi:MAG: 50S ribosomal protein L2 [Candidatus Paceibacterota bacterium]|jgi:large subunit ribosomal protein L2
MQRKKVKIKNFLTLTKKKPEKSLTVRIKRTGGRGSSGRITTRHIGGGARKLYRIVEFAQKIMDVPAEVMAIEYDPNRNAFIALIQYEGGIKKYIVAPEEMKAGDKIIFSDKAEAKIGNRMKLKNIPEGTMIYNIELQPNKGGVLVRAAGTGAILQNYESGYAKLKMPSSEIRRVSGECFASIGKVSNSEYRFINWSKAGTSRRKGVRPAVRGSAMNPCDHPHGGGEGRTGVGLKHPKTPWGKPALGVKTRKKNKKSSILIIDRRVKKKRK